LDIRAGKDGIAGTTDDAVFASVADVASMVTKEGGFSVAEVTALNNALNAGHAVSAALPLTGQAMEIMQTLKAYGYQKEDHSSILKYYENCPMWS